MVLVLRKTGSLGELRIKDRQLVHVILRRHLSKQIRRAQGETSDLFQLALELNLTQQRIHAGTPNHVLHRLDVAGVVSLSAQKRRGKIRAPAYVNDSVLRPCPFVVLAPFKVAGIVEQDSQEAELGHPLRQRRLRASGMTAAQ